MLLLPITERVNFRVIVFAGVVLCLLGWPVYTFVHETLTQGIEDHGSYVSVDLKSMGNFLFDGTNGTVNDIPARYRALTRNAEMPHDHMDMKE